VIDANEPRVKSYSTSIGLLPIVQFTRTLQISFCQGVQRLGQLGPSEWRHSPGQARVDGLRLVLGSTVLTRYELHRSGAQATMVCLSEFQFEKVRSFIHDELCNRNQLVPEAFPITERVLTKKGAPCGIFFCLHGPRSVRFTAVFDMSESRVLFYDSNGQRTGCHEFATAMPHSN
jgi:hypothetical protein